MTSIITACRSHGSPPHSLAKYLLASCLCAAISTGLAIPPTCAQQTPTALNSAAPTQDLREDARGYLAKGDYDRAIEAYKALLATSPSDTISIKADLGLCYKAKKDYTNAMPLFAEVAAVSGPRQSEVLYWTEDSLCEQGKFADAVELLTRMYTQNPELREHVLARRADRLEVLGRAGEAAADLKELVASYPDDPQRANNILKVAALTLRAYGPTPEFNQALAQAFAAAHAEQDPGLKVSLKKNVAGVCFSLEDTMWANGKKAEAMDYLAKMLSEQPEAKADALHRLAMRFAELGRNNEAVASYREFAKTYPGDERALTAALSAAECAFRAKDPKADQTLSWAQGMLDSSDLEPDHAKRLKSELGLIFIRTGQFDRAEQAFQSLLKDYPNDPEITLNLGLVYRGRTDYNKALPLIEDAINNAQGDTKCEALCRYTDCLLDQKKFDQALSYLASAVTDYPEFGTTLLSKRAKCSRDDVFNYNEASFDFNRLTAQYPDTAGAIDAEVGLAEIRLFADKKPAEARAMLEKFIADHPTYMDMICVRRNLASCAYQEGDYAKAARLYAEALKLPETGTWHPFLMYMIADCYCKLNDIPKAVLAFNQLIAKHPTTDWGQLAAERSKNLQTNQEATR